MTQDNLILGLIFGMILCFLFGIYWFLKKRKQDKQLRYISDKLVNILAGKTSEEIMVFSDDTVLIDLLRNLNSMLAENQSLNLEYQRAEHALKQMISNISHDIKTPLTVILGYLEIALLEDPSDVRLQKIQQKAEQVSTFVNEFFSLAKLEAGDSEMELNQLDFGQLCKGAIIDLYQILNERSFTVDVQIPEKRLYIYGNADALNRILMNLLMNAMNHGGEGKYLGLVVYEEKQFVFAEVVDRGKGMNASEIKHVFDRLYTSEGSRNSKYGGSGLGLAITKSLVERLGGEITVSSTPYQETKFRIKFKKSNILSEERNL